MIMGARNLASIDLYVNGAFRNSYPGTTTSIILDSLITFTRGSTDITLRGTNTAGAAWASATVLRNSDRPWDQEAMHVRYYTTDAFSGEISARDAYLQRSLTLLTIYTDYSVPTDGSRNGRVFHWSVEDVLGWIATYPAFAWNSIYSMSSIRLLNRYDESPRGAPFPGYGYNNSSALCASPEEFATADVTSGSALIPENGLSMSDIGYPTYYFPASITVTP